MQCKGVRGGDGSVLGTNLLKSKGQAAGELSSFENLVVLGSHSQRSAYCIEKTSILKIGDKK